jgi:FAD/FMN-containing dehydrogenase
VAGYIAAGGFNMQMRAMGMAVERVKSVKAVLASGEVVVASQESHQDLFWAMLGGGGGTYAVAVEFVLRLTPLPNSAMLYLNCKFPLLQVVVKRRQQKEEENLRVK